MVLARMKTYQFFIPPLLSEVEKVLGEILLWLEWLGLESLSQSLGEHQGDVLLLEVVNIWVRGLQECLETILPFVVCFDHLNTCFEN